MTTNASIYELAKIWLRVYIMRKKTLSIFRFSFEISQMLDLTRRAEKLNKPPSTIISLHIRENCVEKKGLGQSAYTVFAITVSSLMRLNSTQQASRDQLPTRSVQPVRAQGQERCSLVT